MAGKKPARTSNKNPARRAQRPGPRVRSGASGGGETLRDLKRSRDQLLEQRDFVNVILDTVRALVVVLDRKGRIVRFNRACQQATGYSFEEVKGVHVWDLLLIPEEVEPVKAVFAELARDALPNTYENYWVTKDGYLRLIAWSNAVILGDDGSVKYVIGSGLDITERRRAEEAVSETEDALRRSQKELRALAAGLLTAQEEERKRVSRELHDDLNQRLAMLAVDVETLEQEMPGSPDLLREKLRSLRDRVAELTDDVRRTAHQLHPSILEHLGLEPALESYCAGFSRKEAIEVQFTPRSLPESIPPDVALCLYRVTQEGLRNVARHSGARRASVKLTGSRAGMDLRIADNGCGFDREAANNGGGLGLISMAERVRVVGGTISIRARPGRGTRIDVRVPLAEAGKETSSFEGFG